MGGGEGELGGVEGGVSGGGGGGVEGGVEGGGGEGPEGGVPVGDGGGADGVTGDGGLEDVGGSAVGEGGDGDGTTGGEPEGAAIAHQISAPSPQLRTHGQHPDSPESHSKLAPTLLSRRTPARSIRRR